ncbi:MAG: NTP transferase domain-containing protein, partial [Candidatus Omnitrophica bacterium]|nr:NTP transferase domain-containing protein [Candidatus Omnitrophota bacterium]
MVYIKPYGVPQERTAAISEFLHALGIKCRYFRIVDAQDVADDDPCATHYEKHNYKAYIEIPVQYASLLNMYIFCNQNYRIESGDDERIRLAVTTMNEELIGLGDNRDTFKKGAKAAGFVSFEELELSYLPGVVISKELVRKVYKGKQVPEFLVEYILVQLNRMHIFNQAGSQHLKIRSAPVISMPGRLISLDFCWNYSDAYEVNKQGLLEVLKQVADSWNLAQAISYRKQQGIPEDFNMNIIIQEGFSPENENWGFGGLYTRNPDTGEKGLFGRFIEHARGEEIMTQGQSGKDLSCLEPELCKQLQDAASKLEEYMRYPQEIEFAYDGDTVIFLQTRPVRFSVPAELNYWRSLYNSAKISLARYITKLESLQKRLKNRTVYRIVNGAKYDFILRGETAISGAMQGKLFFSAENAVKCASKGEGVVFLATPETRESIIDVIFGFSKAGLITTYGSTTSHEAVLTRDAGIPCIINVKAAVKQGHLVFESGHSIKEGQNVVIDGDNNLIFVSDNDVLIEDRVVIDASFGVDMPQLRNTIESEYRKFSYQQLLVFIVMFHNEYLRAKTNGDKEKEFTFNFKEHVLHKLLESKGVLLGKNSVQVDEDLRLFITASSAINLHLSDSVVGVESIYARGSGGSGFVFHESGKFYYILTCRHVIDSNRPLDDRRNLATIIALSKKHVLETKASIVIESCNPDLVILRLDKNNISRGVLTVLPLANELTLKESRGKINLAFGCINRMRVIASGKVFEERLLKSLFNTEYLVLNNNVKEGFSGGPVVYKNRALGVIESCSEFGRYYKFPASIFAVNSMTIVALIQMAIISKASKMSIKNGVVKNFVDKYDRKVFLSILAQQGVSESIGAVVRTASSSVKDGVEFASMTKLFAGDSATDEHGVIKDVGIVLLAGGKSSRMQPQLDAEGLQTKLGFGITVDDSRKPMIAYTLDALRMIKGAHQQIPILVLTGHAEDYIRNFIKNSYPDLNVRFHRSVGEETTEALAKAKNVILAHMQGVNHIVIMPADVPGIRPETILRLIKIQLGHHLKVQDRCSAEATLVVAKMPKERDSVPAETYGVIPVDKRGYAAGIIESSDYALAKKDKTPVIKGKLEFPAQKVKGIKLFNGGVCVLSKVVFQELLSASCDYRLRFTSLIDLLIQLNRPVRLVKVDDADEIIGVNTPEQLKQVTEVLNKRFLIGKIEHLHGILRANVHDLGNSITNLIMFLNVLLPKDCRFDGIREMCKPIERLWAYDFNNDLQVLNRAGFAFKELDEENAEIARESLDRALQSQLDSELSLVRIIYEITAYLEIHHLVKGLGNNDAKSLLRKMFNKSSFSLKRYILRRLELTPKTISVKIEEGLTER